jgi:uncharacterized membrane protein YebE (DUF533 family)
MTAQQKTTETTDETVDATSTRDHPLKRLASTANTATAVAALGASVALGSVMTRPVYKFLVGVAVVVLIASLAGMAYRRYVQAESAAEETPPS